ncbi:MAG: Uncharacterized N-acetyltransferase YedL, partial [uncultured Nocardioides sp.]
GTDHHPRRPHRSPPPGVPPGAPRRHGADGSARESPRTGPLRPAGARGPALGGRGRRRHRRDGRPGRGRRHGRRAPRGGQEHAYGAAGTRPRRGLRTARPPGRRRPLPRGRPAVAGDREHGVLRPGPGALPTRGLRTLRAVRVLRRGPAQRLHDAAAV